MEDDEDIAGDGGEDTLAVPGMAPTSFAVIRAENERLGREAASTLGKSYDEYAARLRAQRRGPTQRERISDALLAFAQPTRSFGQAVVNAGSNLSQTQKEVRSGREAQDDELSKAQFQRDQTLAKLQQAYGLKGLDAMSRQAVAETRASASANKPPTLQPSVVSPTGVAQNPFTGAILEPGTAVTKGGQTVRIADLVEKYGPAAVAAAGGPPVAAGVPPPPAPPTAADGAPGGGTPPAMPTGPTQPPHRLGEQWRGDDGVLYQQNVDGPKKIGDPTPEFAADAEHKKAGAVKDAQERVALQVDREKEAANLKPLVSILDGAADLVKSGNIITGAGAVQRLEAARVLALAGDKKAQARVNATDQYLNAVRRQLGPVIKQFGSGTAISDSDRRVAEGIVGADIALQQGTLDWILKTSQKVNKYTMGLAIKPEAAKTEKERRSRPPLSSFGK